MSAELEDVEDGDAPAGGAAGEYDPVAAVLAALETRAAEDLYEARPHKTKTGFARDWAL
ncbi:hypothetical protein [Streptomyces sp. NPDC002845]